MKTKKYIQVQVGGKKIKIPKWMIVAVFAIIASLTGITITIEQENDSIIDNANTNQVVSVDNTNSTVVLPTNSTDTTVTTNTNNVSVPNVPTENPTNAIVQPSKPNKPWWTFWKK